IKAADSIKTATLSTTKNTTDLLEETRIGTADLRDDIAAMHSDIISQGDILRRVESSMATTAALEDAKSMLVQALRGHPVEKRHESPDQAPLTLLARSIRQLRMTGRSATKILKHLT